MNWAPCLEQFEPGARPRDTHTCDLRAGHGEPHHCPLCGSSWTGTKGNGQVWHEPKEQA